MFSRNELMYWLVAGGLDRIEEVATWCGMLMWSGEAGRILLRFNGQESQTEMAIRRGVAGLRMTDSRVQYIRTPECFEVRNLSPAVLQAALRMLLAHASSHAVRAVRVSFRHGIVLNDMACLPACIAFGNSQVKWLRVQVVAAADVALDITLNPHTVWPLHHVMRRVMQDVASERPALVSTIHDEAAPQAFRVWTNVDTNCAAFVTRVADALRAHHGTLQMYFHCSFDMSLFHFDARGVSARAVPRLDLELLTNGRLF